MAINFVTGLPRAGKTLFTLARVKEIAEKEGRQVYTCNIPEVTIEGWQTVEHPDQWMMVPNGSIIIVDELQDFWQLAPTGQKVPGPILELSKHGKRGIDFWFITQEPQLVHRTPRSLCQHHYYVVRAWGSQGGMVHKFERMQDHPEKAKRLSEKTPWRYPKEAFGRVDKATGVVIVKPWYKSADMHNVKRQVPLKVFAIPAGLLLAAGAIWLGLKLFQGTLDKAKSNGPGTAVTAAGAASAPARVSSPGYGGSRRQEPMSTADYVKSFQPRVDGLPHTASRYDGITQATVAPYPAACIRMGSRCSCYSQQGTALSVSHDLCVEIVHKGFFVDWQQQSPTGGVSGGSGQVARSTDFGGPGAQLVAAQPSFPIRSDAVNVARLSESIGPPPRPARQASRPH